MSSCGARKLQGQTLPWLLDVMAGLRYRIIFRIAFPMGFLVAAPCFTPGETVLIPSDIGALDKFGSDVAVAGDVLVVGAVGDKNTYKGAAYVFQRHAQGTNAWGEVAKLTASDGMLYDYFGSCVAIHGDTALVGAPYSDAPPTNNNAGSAYVYQRNVGGLNAWGEVAVLRAPDPGFAVQFGSAVAIDGDVAVIGAMGEHTVMGKAAGAVYVFERDHGGTHAWGLVSVLTADDGSTNDNFGGSVAIDGHIIVVGSEQDDDAGLTSGSAYVYERNAGGVNRWGQVAKLVPTEHLANDRFGCDVDVDGDVMVIGSNLDDDMGDGSGSAYVFERDTGDTNRWNETAKLTASDGAAQESFGKSVAVCGHVILIGCYAQNVVGMTSGSAYLFERHAGGMNAWGQARKIVPTTYHSLGDHFGEHVALDGDVALIASEYDTTFGNGAGLAYVHPVLSLSRNFEETTKLTDPFGTDGDGFGYAVAVDGGMVLVGTPNDDESGEQSGNVHVYERHRDGSNAWGRVTDLRPADATNHQWFGFSLAADADAALVGAAHDNEHGTRAGAAYIFERLTNGWQEIAKLTASDAAAEAKFGDAVSLDGDLALVGASYDTGYEAAAGRAYLFGRNAGGTNAWGEVAGLTAPDGSSSNHFGQSVAVAGDVALVGANGADGSGGINGAAYIFERNAGGSDTWGHVAKLTASDGAPHDEFGFAVAADGDVAVVGAHGKEGGAVYVYERDLGGTNAWGEVKKLTADDGGSLDKFGYAVAIDHDVILAGAFENDLKGAVYIFQRNAGGTNNWGLTGKWLSRDLDTLDAFGFSVTLEGDVAVVGAIKDDNGGDPSGSAYVFEYVEPRPIAKLGTMVIQGSDVMCSWEARESENYTFQTSDRIGDDAVWSNRVVVAQPGSNGVMSVTDPLADGNTYYRIQAWNDPLR